MAKPNKANKAQSGEKSNNQPDHHGGDLPSAGGRQPLNAAAEPPIHPPLPIFEVAEVVENQEVSCWRTCQQEIKSVLYVQHGTSFTYRCQASFTYWCQATVK